MRICILLFSFFLTLPAHILVAQSTLDADKPLARYGVYGNFNLNSHNADFRTFPGVPNCCPKFQDGSGNGLSFGLLYDLPFTPQWFLSLRAGYENYSAKLTTSEPQELAGGISGVFEHRVTADLASVGIEPSIGFKPIRNLNLNAGIRTGFVIQKNYSQVEIIVQPSDKGVFSNGKSTRNDTSGVIPNANSMSINFLAGISYDLPINGNSTLFLVPEIQYSYGLAPIISGYDWQANSLHLGISLKYSPKPSVEIPVIIPEPPKKEEPIIVEKKLPLPVIEKKKPSLTAEISANEINADGVELPVNHIKIEEFASTALHPLLQYVFFDENSAEIPKKYSRIEPQNTDNFSLRSFINVSSMDLYYEVLNVVGYRMKTAPRSTITVTGCNSNEGNELNNTDLSRSRAESVKNYIVDTWGIDKKRIKIAQRNLPVKPSNSSIKEGIEENRRVEISSGDDEIIKPIIIDDTLRRTSIRAIRFRPTVNAEAGLAEWSLTAHQSQGLSTKFDGKSEIQPTIDWSIESEMTKTGVRSDVEYALTVKDNEGQTVTKRAVIPVEQVTIQKKRDEKLADKVIDRYSLILFDFDKADFDKRNQSILSFIKKRISSDAQVSITGFTDQTGDEEHNMKLAQMRAATTAQVLGLKANVVDTKGEQKFSNNTPEGRFYNRTVEILVETAVK